MNKIKEISIENRLIDYYKENNYVVNNQVKFAQKRIDIITRRKNNNNICAIEVKISDWKTALRQACLNLVACNEAYVAIWHRHAKQAMNNKDLFRENGVGLIVVDEFFKPEVMFKSRKNKNVNMSAYEYVLNSL